MDRAVDEGAYCRQLQHSAGGLTKSHGGEATRHRRDVDRPRWVRPRDRRYTWAPRRDYSVEITLAMSVGKVGATPIDWRHVWPSLQAAASVIRNHRGDWHSSVVSWPALPHVSHASVAQFHNIWHSYRRHSLIHYTGDRLVRSREAKEPSFIPPSHP